MDFVVVAGGEEVHDLGGRLAARDLGGVERVGLHEDDPAVGDGLVDLGFGVSARILQDGVHALEVVEPAQVFGRGDEDGEEGLAEGRWPHVNDLDAIAPVADELVVLDELGPVRELPVRAHLVAEELFRRGNPGRGRGVLLREEGGRGGADVQQRRREEG